jgi:alpha-D-ribose 1-methylphosphonate 5-triphosphate synthase subunit PhnG
MSGNKASASDDPRRHKPIRIHSDGLIGRLLIDGETWGAVEWSEKRQAFCIEDAEGRCLSHYSHIHGEDKDKASAVALAEAMIRDGRMPTPEDAKTARQERLKRDRERRAKQPSEIKRREARAERHRLWLAYSEAGYRERQAERDEPLYEVLADALDLTDPDLWRSNSFARLRDRLISCVQAAIAELESDLSRHRTDRGKRVKRAQEILALLQPEDWVADLDSSERKGAAN